MTVEQLMQPRYMQIITYPSGEYSMGKITVLDKIGGDGRFDGYYAYTEDYGAVSEGWFEMYSEVFKKLEWYEERKIEDMPEYVKYDQIVFKVDYWKPLQLVGLRPASNDKEIDSNLSPSWHYFAKQFLPATEQEYLQFKNSL